ncbi:hypothetical protein GCM10025857_01840 [Alicyclobacillus contaminans]|nr:hypothetical protein GCM10025857_01840 [Alicyclobacillus contaminans]
MRFTARTTATTNDTKATVNDPNWIINDSALATLMAPPLPENRAGSEPQDGTHM